MMIQISSRIVSYNADWVPITVILKILHISHTQSPLLNSLSTQPEITDAGVNTYTSMSLCSHFLKKKFNQLMTNSIHYPWFKIFCNF